MYVFVNYINVLKDITKIQSKKKTWLTFDISIVHINSGADPHGVCRVLEHPLTLLRNIYIYVETDRYLQKINIEHPINKSYSWPNDYRMGT